eukprot:SAG11_NODE_35110_length_268_cov_0.893491_1_plen_63_part_01
MSAAGAAPVAAEGLLFTYVLVPQDTDLPMEELHASATDAAMGDQLVTLLQQHFKGGSIKHVDQ